MDSMINFRLPFSWFSPAEKADGNLPGVEIKAIHGCDVESVEEKSGRRLRHLLKLNHATNSILYNNLTYYNYIPHLLSTAYLLGGNSDHLDRLYEAESKELEPWRASPSEIGQAEDWRLALGKREFQRAYLDFFEDELSRMGYDWNAVVLQYLCSGEKPLINSLIAGFGHPLIHLGYAFEVSSRDIAMESLAMISCCYDDIHKFFDEPSDLQKNITPKYTTSSPFEVLHKIHRDDRFDGIFASPGGSNLEVLLKTQQGLILEHWMAWDLQDTNLTEQLHAIQRLATILMVTRHGGKKHDLLFDHLLTTTHALRVIIPLVPKQFHGPLLRQWLLLTVGVYVAQLRPNIDVNDIKCYNVDEKDWNWVDTQALTGDMATLAHYIKPLRTLKEAAKTWTDEDDFFLRAAVKFIETFDGFSSG
ncbi:MGS207 protein [Nannizzia gypsea CBS 118893]|uniref:MGS207 protein n=1 Tax=Arthroderma gypseum (strain ATCC MYA-4604 / CBS 118893) TaxID=535722 RepID=E4UYK8_ARTGP|nr:MGS207 protein [Nannizzia gypsea CBS 118893]EFR02171.1 MGS207 protein [Nannizzia gypsea CBS 118893]